MAFFFTKFILGTWRGMMGNRATVLQALTHLLPVHSKFKTPSTVALEDHSRNISIIRESRRAHWSGVS